MHPGNDGLAIGHAQGSHVFRPALTLTKNPLICTPGASNLAWKTVPKMRPLFGPGIWTAVRASLQNKKFACGGPEFGTALWA